MSKMVWVDDPRGMELIRSHFPDADVHLESLPELFFRLCAWTKVSMKGATEVLWIYADNEKEAARIVQGDDEHLGLAQMFILTGIDDIIHIESNMRHFASANRIALLNALPSFTLPLTITSDRCDSFMFNALSLDEFTPNNFNQLLYLSYEWIEHNLEKFFIQRFYYPNSFGKQMTYLSELTKVFYEDANDGRKRKRLLPPEPYHDSDFESWREKLIEDIETLEKMLTIIKKSS